MPHQNRALDAPFGQDLGQGMSRLLHGRGTVGGGALPMAGKLHDQHAVACREERRHGTPVVAIPADAVHEDDRGRARAAILHAGRRGGGRREGREEHAGRAGGQEGGPAGARAHRGRGREGHPGVVPGTSVLVLGPVRDPARPHRAGSAASRRWRAWGEAWSVGMSRSSWTFTWAGRVTAQATASATSSARSGCTPR